MSAMAIIMDTAAEPDTKSAGTLLKLFSKPIVFIFFILLNRTIKKLSAADYRREF